MNKYVKISLIIIFTIFIILSIIYIITNEKKTDLNHDTKDKKEWETTLGGNQNEAGWYVLPTSEGGCLVTGYTESYGSGESDVWLVKFDEKGNEKWNKTFGGTGTETGKAIQNTSDGNYIVVGSTTSYGNGYSDVWVIKLDIDGNELWNNTYGGSKNDTGRSIIITDNNMYVILGETWSYGSGKSDFWLIKINSQGNEIWNKTYGGSEEDQGRSLVYSDEKYVLAGGTRSYGSGEEDIWILKADDEGNEIWNNTFGTSERIEYCNQVINAENESFVLVGHSLSQNYSSLNSMIVKANSQGQLEWKKDIEENVDTGLSSIAEINDGYLGIGYIGSFTDGQQDVLIVKIDFSGNILWTKSMGKENHTDAGIWVDGSRDEYFITGYRESLSDNENNLFLDLLLLKIEV